MLLLHSVKSFILLNHHEVNNYMLLDIDIDKVLLTNDFIAKLKPA